MSAIIWRMALFTSDGTMTFSASEMPLIAVLDAAVVL
jgi:hypothetical protein